MKTTTTIKYPFYKMDADLQQAIIESLAQEIEIHESDGTYNPEDKAISRLADAEFVISNECSHEMKPVIAVSKSEVCQGCLQSPCMCEALKW